MSQSKPSLQPFYISGQSESFFATLHDATAPARDVAVVLCPPFGWEDMCSYRSRLEWASSLAGAGFPVLRIDYPGSGDSPGGPRDHERLRAWTDAVGASARWLSSAYPSCRILAFGIGLGGAFAYRATALGAPVDDLVLWGVRSRGRRHVRELRAFSYMEHSRDDDDAPPSSTVEDSDDGSLVAAGYVLSSDTRRELDELDLAELNPERLQSARVLMLERDGFAVDARLQTSIERGGAEVTVSTGDGYGAMMMAELPHAVSAYGVFDKVAAWLAQRSVPVKAELAQRSAPVAAAGARAPSGVGVADSCVEIEMPGGERVRETPITISHPLGNPVGILTEPLGPAVDLCAVWLNAGPQRRIGPNRMWVETARRWAALGVPTVRIDLAAIGDAEGDSRALLDVRSYYTGAYMEQVRTVLDALQARGLPPRFLLGGLCAGAHWALSVAQDDPRVSAAAVLNAGYLVYDGGLSNAIGASRELAPRLFTRAMWARVLRGEVTPASQLRKMRLILTALLRGLRHRTARLLGRGDDSNEITQAFDRLRAQNKRALIMFAGEEWLYTELLSTGRLKGLERWPNVSLVHIDVAGDMHTLRPLQMQAQAQQLIDGLLQGELERNYAIEPLTLPTTDCELEEATSDYQVHGHETGRA
jgi:alpha-beta hydrolase superfamily lysophospholipase